MQYRDIVDGQRINGETRSLVCGERKGICEVCGTGAICACVLCGSLRARKAVCKGNECFGNDGEKLDRGGIYGRAAGQVDGEGDVVFGYKDSIGCILSRD